MKEKTYSDNDLKITMKLGVTDFKAFLTHHLECVVI